jgi:uncharacterized cupredoxin-like copper-binding protein
VILIAAACSDDDGDESAHDLPDLTAPPEPVTTASGTPTYLEVRLSEWSVRSEGSEQLTAAAGRVIITVENIGEIPHELAVLTSDADPGALPVVDSLVDEDAVGPVVGRTGTIESNRADTLTIDLEAGTYVAICNIDGHYESGMYAPFTVK